MHSGKLARRSAECGVPGNVDPERPRSTTLAAASGARRSFRGLKRPIAVLIVTQQHGEGIGLLPYGASRVLGNCFR
jgi:hypothetical protein